MDVVSRLNEDTPVNAQSKNHDTLFGKMQWCTTAEIFMQPKKVDDFAQESFDNQFMFRISCNSNSSSVSYDANVGTKKSSNC